MGQLMAGAKKPLLEEESKESLLDVRWVFHQVDEGHTVAVAAWGDYSERIARVVGLVKEKHCIHCSEHSVALTLVQYGGGAKGVRVVSRAVSRAVVLVVQRSSGGAPPSVHIKYILSGKTARLSGKRQALTEEWYTALLGSLQPLLAHLGIPLPSQCSL